MTLELVQRLIHHTMFTHLGLMPGPVDSPSSDAIEASVKPDKEWYLYFEQMLKMVKVYFATTKEEHESKRCKAYQ